MALVDAEERVQTLSKENKSLVDRWMKKESLVSFLFSFSF